jgi:hypothetical protein
VAGLQVRERRAEQGRGEVEAQSNTMVAWPAGCTCPPLARLVEWMEPAWNLDGGLLCDGGESATASCTSGSGLHGWSEMCNEKGSVHDKEWAHLD